MTTPVSLPLTARTNADWFAVIQCQVGGVAVDLTGATADLTVQDYNGATCLVLAPGTGLTIDAVNGTITILVAAARMAGLKPGTYRYDLQLRRGNGISVPVEGQLQIAQGVGRV